MYADFVSEVDPKGGIMDWMLQEEILSFEQKDQILSDVTRQERCRRLLDVLFASSNPRAFTVLRQSLVNEKKSWIVERIDAIRSTAIDTTVKESVPGWHHRFVTKIWVRHSEITTRQYSLIPSE